MDERTIEQKLRTTIKKMGGLCLKFVSPSLDGVPDRIILLPGGYVGFAEIKSTGKIPRPLQLRRKRQIERLGFTVFIIDRPEQIGEVLDEIKSQV